jgi:hypothetical protein
VPGEAAEGRVGLAVGLGDGGAGLLDAPAAVDAPAGLDSGAIGREADGAADALGGLDRERAQGVSARSSLPSFW